MEEQLADKAARIARAMRASGSSDPVASAEQVSILLYLKLLDEAEDANASGLAITDAVAGPAIFRRQADRYRWRELRRLDPEELGRFLNLEVLPYMGSLEKDRPAVAAFFRDAELPVEDHGRLWQVVKEIDALHLLHLDAGEAGAFIEKLFLLIGLGEVDGKFGTSSTLRELMVTLTDPKPGETVLDPAMGTAGLLVDAARHVGDRHGNSLHLVGSEVSRTMLRVATVNMALRGLSTDGLRRQDPLEDEEGSDFSRLSRCDVVLCDPPYGARRPTGGIAGHFRRRSNRLEAMFLELAMSNLAIGGRAAVLVPDGLLSSETPSLVDLRRDLLEHFDIAAVLAIPANRLRARGLNSSIVAFRRRAGHEPPVQRVWFHRLATTTRRRGAAGSEDRTGIPDLLRNWERHLARNFDDPPGIPAETVLETGSRPARSWWALRSAIEASGFRLDPSRWAPVVSAWPLNEDPEELAASAVLDYRRLADELELLAKALAT